MRNLCTVQTVLKLENIPGKDRIKLASFVSSDFKVIVDLAIHEGDKVVYCEADTLLPERPEFEFLRARCYLPAEKAFRIRCMKMAGVFSEGIAFPASVFPGITNTSEGLDVTDQLGARKYDPELQAEQVDVAAKRGPFLRMLMRIKFFRKMLTPKKTAGSFPTDLIGKTDETRIQSLPGTIERLGDSDIYISEKLDGRSRTYIMRHGKLISCTRNCTVRNDELAKQLGLEKRMRQIARHLGDFAIQCEEIGPGIQKNKYKLSKPELRLFNIMLLRNRRYLNPFHSDLPNRLGINTVPLLYEGPMLFHSADAGVEYSKGYSVLCPSQEREGIVVRTVTPKNPDPKMANLFSFKIINPDFMLLEE